MRNNRIEAKSLNILIQITKLVYRALKNRIGEVLMIRKFKYINSNRVRKGGVDYEEN